MSNWFYLDHKAKPLAREVKIITGKTIAKNFSLNLYFSPKSTDIYLNYNLKSKYLRGAVFRTHAHNEIPYILNKIFLILYEIIQTEE